MVDAAHRLGVVKTEEEPWGLAPQRVSDLEKNTWAEAEGTAVLGGRRGEEEGTEPSVCSF